MFWLESDTAHKVPGHFTFDPKKGGRVALHGQFVGHDHHRTYERVVGEVSGRSCVLFNCFEVANSSFGTTDGAFERHITLLVNSAIVAPRGRGRGPGREVQFDSVIATFRGLSEFDGRHPFVHDRPGPEDPWTDRVGVKRLDKRVVEADRMTVEILHSPGSAGSDGFDRESVTSTHYLRIKLREPTTLEGILDAFTCVRNLIAVAVHTDCRLTKPLELAMADNDEHTHGDAAFHAVWPRGQRTRRPLFADRTMTFDQLTADGLGRLVDLESRFDHVLRRVVSLRFEKSVAFEDAIVRVVSAADAFHRELTGHLREPTRKMLTESAERIGNQYTQFVPDLDMWAADVVRARDDAAHNKGHPIREAALAEPMVMSVYWLTILGLLGHADVPTRAISAVVGSQPFIRTMGPIRDAYGTDPATPTSITV